MHRDTLIIYMSRTAHVFEGDALQRMAADAAARNAEKGITGVLVKAGNYFLQVLEGPEQPVLGLLDRISQDPRHREVRVVYRESCERRLFGQWGMGCVNLDERYALDLKDFRALRERVHRVMSPQGAGREAMMEVIRSFPGLLEEHRA